MPSRAITLSLNADQTKKSVYLLPEGTKDARSALIAEGQKKFRKKGLSVVYLPGGEILDEGSALPATISIVYLSKGEDFLGKPVSAPGSSREPGTVSVAADESFIDEKAISQLKAVAALEGVLTACGMPDLHPGDRFPVGCAIIAEGIYPVLIGSDVGCGIALYELNATGRLADHPDRLAKRLKGLDAPWDGSASEWLSQYGLDHLFPEFDSSLGTIGLGNHFAEICRVEKIVDEEEAQRLGIRVDAVYLMGTPTSSR